MIVNKLVFCGTIVIGVAACALFASRFFPVSYGGKTAMPEKPLVENLTQSLQVVKVSFNEYDQRVKTKPGLNAPTEVVKLRDYVITLKNNSSRDVIAYRLDFTKTNDTRLSQGVMAYPVYSETPLTPGREEAKRVIGIPADHNCRVSLAIFTGWTYEGDSAIAEAQITRLRASGTKIAEVRNRLADIVRLPNHQVGLAVQQLVSDVTQAEGRASRAHAEHDSFVEQMRAYGEYEGLSIARLSLNSITQAKSAESTRRVAEMTLQRFNAYFEKLR
jgi:hypothetical protein